MKKVVLKCTCGKDLVYCSELKHKATGRPLFKCACEEGYITFRNKDNFGYRK